MCVITLTTVLQYFKLSLVINIKKVAVPLESLINYKVVVTHHDQLLTLKCCIALVINIKVAVTHQ